MAAQQELLVLGTANLSKEVAHQQPQEKEVRQLSEVAIQHYYLEDRCKLWRVEARFMARNLVQSHLQHPQGRVLRKAQWVLFSNVTMW